MCVSRIYIKGGSGIYIKGYTDRKVCGKHELRESESASAVPANRRIISSAKDNKDLMALLWLVDF
jgi:hypothetical protein